MIPTDELIKRVRHLLNEAEEDVGLSLLSEDTRSINVHISRLLPQAVALVQKNKAPGSGNVNPRKAKVDETTVIDCVIATNQTYVDALKAEGKFDADAHREAFKKT